jgi:hypothetical protein
MRDLREPKEMRQARLGDAPEQGIGLGLDNISTVISQQIF